MELNFRTVFCLNGIILCGIAVVMFIPLIYDIFFSNSQCVYVFSSSISLCLFLGTSVIFSSATNINSLTFSQKDAFLIVVCFWIVVSFCSAFPFYLYDGHKIDFMTALFESVSGITVTGATIYSDVESLPEAINLWRFMLHFIGGIGIITIAILVLPTLRVGGMQLFRTENSDKSEKLLPRISQVLAVFSLMCIAFIVYISFLLKMAGMSNFDAICHSISAIMTGGFSTKNNGIAYYDNRLIEFIVAVAMFFGGLTFMEIINCFKNGVKHFYKNQQIRGYIKLFFFSVLTVAFLYFIKNNNGISLKVFIGFVFQVASSITTTGYDLIASNVDSIAKGAAPCMKFLFIVLLAIGGCSGSTSSGIKIFRLQIIWGILKNHIKKQIKPNHVNTVEYYEQVVDGQVIVSVVSFLSLLAISFFVSTFLICLINQYDISVGLAATFSCIFNSGYPVEFLTSLQIPYSDMNGLTKLILMIDMLVGRLEFISVFVILSLKFWKK